MNWKIWQKSILLLTMIPLLTACAPKKKPVIAPEGPPQPPWTQAQYAQFDYKSFAKHLPANTVIKTKYFDFRLLNAAVFYETNRQRVLNGKAPFQYSPALEKTAWDHSRDMVARNFFSHDSPIAGKESLEKRLVQVRIINSRAAENIKVGFVLDYEAGTPVFTPEQNKGFFSYKYKGKPIPNHTYNGIARALLKGWMKSPGQRQNILNERLTYMGAGGDYFLEDKFWHKVKFTQNFSDQKGSG